MEAARVLVMILLAGVSAPAVACPSCRLGQRVRASVVGAGFATHVAGVVLPPVLVVGAAVWLHGRGRERPRGPW
jgi:hypothetical protein